MWTGTLVPWATVGMGAQVNWHIQVEQNRERVAWPGQPEGGTNGKCVGVHWYTMSKQCG